MDISNRKSLLISLNKTAQREVSKDVARRVREPFRVMTPEDRIERLKGLRETLSSPTGEMTYTAEQKRQLASYQDLFDNWDSYKEYVNGPMQALGDWVAEKTIVPAVKAGVSLFQGAKEHGIEGADKPDREKAIKELEKASSYAVEEMVKNGANINDLQIFKQTHSALKSNDFNKIASRKIVIEDISSAFEAELDNSYEILHHKYAEEYSNNLNLDADTYNKFYELAVAHHILTQEGHLKDAFAIDSFVIKNASLWNLKKEAGWLGKAWDATKSAVSTGVTYMAKAVKGAGKAVLWGATKVWRIAAKGIKFLVSKLPFLGILFSVPFMIKNLIEAYYNGKRILSDLDLPKYGFSRMKSITPIGLPHVRETFRNAVDKHRRNPDALKEIITIFRTIGAFWIDTLFAITNGFMAILDAIAIAGLFFPGVGWLVSVGAMGGSFLLAAGVAGLEIGAEYFKDHYWDKDAAYMLEEAKKAVNELLSEGTPVVQELDFELVEDDMPPLPSNNPSPAPSTPNTLLPPANPGLTLQPAF